MDGLSGCREALHGAVLEAAGVGPGTRLLDLGCGPGLFARAAAERGARVTGVDLDRAAVAAAAAAVPEGSFAVRTALDPPAGPFDVVAAVQLLMHVPDPAAVLRAAARSAPLLVATVWGREEECDLRGFGEALAPLLGAPPPRSPSLPVSDPGRLRALAEEAGMTVERLDEVGCALEYDDEDDLIAPLLASGLGRAAARRAGPAAVRAAVLERLASHRTDSGGYRLANLFRVLVARRPDSGTGAGS